MQEHAFTTETARDLALCPQFGDLSITRFLLELRVYGEWFSD